MLLIRSKSSGTDRFTSLGYPPNGLTRTRSITEAYIIQKATIQIIFTSVSPCSESASDLCNSYDQKVNLGKMLHY